MLSLKPLGETTETTQIPRQRGFGPTVAEIAPTKDYPNMMPRRYWQDMTTTDFGRLDRARVIAVLPVAAIEQHGPHLPVAVDTWPCAVGYDLNAVLPKSDVVMMLRVQRERMSGGFFPTAREYTAGYGLTRERLKALPEHAVICHPGPMNRGLEIASDAADAAQSLILDQVSAGVAVRMSVLYHLLAGEGTIA